MKKFPNNCSSEWNGFFNWTMTFRQDSDFFTPYGQIQQIRSLPSDIEAYMNEFSATNSELAGNKKKAVAWFVSNCDTPSNRMEYVKGIVADVLFKFLQ